MVDRLKLAKIAFWIGVLGIFGTITSGNISSQPVSSSIPFFLTIPYLYTQFKTGARDVDQIEQTH